MYRLPPFQSVAVGVGKLGEQEQSVALVLSPNATGSESEGQHSVTKRLKGRSDSPPRPGSIFADVGRIFSDHNARAKCINNADELTAEALLADVTESPGRTVFLAGVASADNIDAPISGRREGSNVIPAADVWPVLCEHAAGELGDFNLPGTAHPRSLESKVKTTDPGEQAPKRQLHVPPHSTFPILCSSFQMNEGY
jgi:hypothetical protein